MAVASVQRGADVVLTARRAEKLAEAVAEAGGGHPVAADVHDAADCERLVADAVDRLGGLDLVVYAAGASPLKHLADTTAVDFTGLFATNVVGVHQVICAALAHLAEGSIVAVLSSETVGRPRVALGGYSVSKAALEELLRAWRAEHPTVRFSTLAVGATVPTGFGDEFDGEVLGVAFEDWLRNGFMQTDFMATTEVGEILVETLASALDRPTVNVEHLTLRSPSATLGTPEG
jgi:NAD(P)-dependent dehydrogenase (short-subunit alcohol dehydrogenase family)